jgi:hypothetical protein
MAMLVVLLLAAGPASAAQDLLQPWPNGDSLRGIAGEQVTFPSHSPFTLDQVGKGAELDPATEAVGTLYLPDQIEAPVPAVILLHGASGVRGAREQTYGRQFAAMGIAALVIDAFAPRRNMGNGFIERVLKGPRAVSNRQRPSCAMLMLTAISHDKLAPNYLDG